MLSALLRGFLSYTVVLIYNWLNFDQIILWRISRLVLSVRSLSLKQFNVVIVVVYADLFGSFYYTVKSKSGDYFGAIVGIG